jgi:hypothetical protein
MLTKTPAKLFAMAVMVFATLCAGTPGYAEEAVTALPVKQSVKVWVVGDSTAQPLSLGLERNIRERAEYKLRTLYRNSSGLARPDFFDWPKVAKEQLEINAPDVAFISFGPNDTQGLLPPGKRLSVPMMTPEWRAEYARRIDAFVGLFSAKQVRVYLVLQSYNPQKKYAASMDEINAALREAAERLQVEVVDTPQLLADDNGEFQRVALDSHGKPIALRSEDGLHLTGAGGGYLAKRVLRILEADLAHQAEPTAQIQREQGRQGQSESVIK